MVTETSLQEKIERWKLLADEFNRDNTKAFIKDIYDNWYFCYIVLIGENSVNVQHFKGKKKFEKDNIRWANVVKFDEYIPQEGEEL